MAVQTVLSCFHIKKFLESIIPSNLLNYRIVRKTAQEWLIFSFFGAEVRVKNERSAARSSADVASGCHSGECEKGIFFCS